MLCNNLTKRSVVYQTLRAHDRHYVLNVWANMKKTGRSFMLDAVKIERRVITIYGSAPRESDGSLSTRRVERSRRLFGRSVGSLKAKALRWGHPSAR